MPDEDDRASADDTATGEEWEPRGEEGDSESETTKRETVGPGAWAEDILDLPTRKEIFEHVEANPGIHFNQLKRDLNIETGALQYHLRELERYDVLESDSYQGKRRLFVARELDEEEKSILATLRYETTRHVLLTLLREGPARNTELAEAVGVTPATISWHLSNLVEEGVVEERQEGRNVRYDVTNEELTVQLLVRYQESFVDRAVDRIIDFWG